jgi:hypothetical protein
MEERFISPNFYQDLSKHLEILRDESITKIYDSGDTNTKIAIYQDRVSGWFLDIAQDLKETEEAGFIILMICLAHLEGVAQYRRGMKTPMGESSKVLKEEIKRVFTIPSFHQKAIDILVEDARHGLFHDCMTRRRIFLSQDYLNPIIWDEVAEIVQINPHTFLDAIISDFSRYVVLLSDPENKIERENFLRVWDYCDDETKLEIH